jgi:hypothetical protein
MAHLSSAPPRGDDAENGERERDAYSSVDPPLSREDALRLIGPRHSKETARGVADGALHPMTLEAYAPLPTSGAPKHRNPSVASFFPGASKPRPRSADAVRETSALAALSTPRFGAHPASADAADAADRTETEKTPCAVRTEPPRAPERWVTPPALTAANPSKRAFYALLRASPSRAAAESPLESRFGVRPATEKESPGKTAKRSRRTAVGLEGPRTRQNPDDVADADEAAATAHRAAEKREATEPPRAAAHPFYLTPRSTPASARSRYFAAPVAAPPAETRVSSPGRAEAAEAASNPAEASAARSEARAEKENETTATTTTTTTTAKKPLFERFAFGAK